MTEGKTATVEKLYYAKYLGSSVELRKWTCINIIQYTITVVSDGGVLGYHYYIPHGMEVEFWKQSDSLLESLAIWLTSHLGLSHKDYLIEVDKSPKSAFKQLVYSSEAVSLRRWTSDDCLLYTIHQHDAWVNCVMTMMPGITEKDAIEIAKNLE